MLTRCLVAVAVGPLGRLAHRPSVRSLALVVESVPILGESITEGSIASWVKNVGDKVVADDVIAVIETDKVTVDVKATRSGVLTKHLATDTVFVGKPLYEIDTDGSSAEPAAVASAPVAVAAPLAASSSTKPRTRQPLIKFIGKRSLAKVDHKPVHPTPIVTCSAPKRTPEPKKPQTGVDFTTLKDTAWYGRPKLSQKEMDAIISGGAY